MRNKAIVFVAMILNILFYLYRIFADLISCTALKQGLQELEQRDSDISIVQQQLQNSIIFNYIEIAVCAVLMIITIIAYIAAYQKEKPQLKRS